MGSRVRCSLGHSVPDDSRFCSECGELLPPPQDGSVDGDPIQALTARSRPTWLTTRNLILGGGMALIVLFVIVMSSDSGSDPDLSTTSNDVQVMTLSEECYDRLSGPIGDLMDANRGGYFQSQFQQVLAQFGSQTEDFRIVRTIGTKAAARQMQIGMQSAVAEARDALQEACDTRYPNDRR